MEDVNISKYRAQVVRAGSTPASPGFVVSEGQNPVDPSGSGQNHLPVTIATAATGLSITESQVLGGAGTVGQYIRGDGSLADFPASTGGGSSVSYYLNGSVSQGTIGGVAYKQLNRTPVFGAGTDFTIAADGYIASFITDASDPNKLLIPAGNWNFETYFSASSNGGSPSFYVELYKYDGTTFTLIATSSSAPELIAFGTSLNPYYSTLAVPQTALALTDRLAIRYFVTHSGRTITLHTEDNHLCQIITTFTTGLTALNGLTAQVQNFAVGTSGTDFAIASATATHTFNLPTASATNRGALSSADWTTFNNKTSNLGTVTSVGLSSATSGVTIGSSPVTTSGTITLAIATASGSQNGLLSSTDWTTFNSKQNALTNPVTGTGTTNYLPKFTGSTTIGNSQIFDNGTQVGINTNTIASDFGLALFGSKSLMVFQNSNTGQTNGDGFIVGSFGGTEAYLFNYEDAALIFGTNAQGRMRITNGGNLLVGTTTDNGARLQVSGDANFVNTINPLILRSTNATTMWTEYYYNTSTLSGYIGSGTGLVSGANASDFIIRSEADLIFTSGGNNRRLTITSSGNVGIGTASPSYTFDVVKSISGDHIAQIRNSSASGFGLLVKNGDNTKSAFRVLNSTDNVVFDVYGSGNVGIGTASPSAKFEVLGLSTFAPSATLTAGDFLVDTNNKTVYLGRQSNITGDNTIVIMRSRTGTVGFSYNPSNSLTFFNDGNVLIGTTTDAGFKLDVAGTGRFTGTITSEIIGPQNLILKSSAQFGGYVQFERSGTIFGYLGNAGSVTGTNTDDMALRSQNGLRFSTGGNNLRMTIDSSGNIGAPSGTNIYNASDLRLKRNISKISSGLDKITSLNPVKFNWLDGFVPSENGKEMLGFIAQEVFEIIPEAVESFGNNSITINNIEIKNPLRVNEKFIIPVLVKAIQELKQEIDTLKN